LIDYLLNEFIPIVDDLRVYSENMLSNLEKNQGLLHSQQVISGLIAKDMPRETANQLVEKYTRLARDQSRSFKDLLQADEQISALLSPAELDDCFDLKHQLKHIDNIFARLGLIN
ncbi:MAG: adenylosuccinate lyase, partial [Firmicutes bacterium]|nr:adenylosuccinate lyase [Bacillota bacterium]